MKSHPNPTASTVVVLQPAPQAVPIDRLKVASWNPRSHQRSRLLNLAASIEADADLLWRHPILAQRDGTVYAGNLRLLAAQHLGLETVPAVIEDIPDRLARERALKDNQQWGSWEEDDLAELLLGLRDAGSDLDLLGFDDRELQQLLDLHGPCAFEDPDAIPALPAEPRSQLGDLWLLGDHRVLCGDSRNADDVVRLMSGARAACLWMDPPYGVDYEGGTKAKLRIINDNAGGLEALLSGAFAAAQGQALAPGAALYVCHPAGPLALTFWRSFEGTGWRIHQGLVWAKDTIVLGHSDYHFRHEPILFGYAPGGGRRGRGHRGWYGRNNAGTLFEVPRPRVSADHPTAKPVALITAMLKNSSRTGAIVYDPFLGSGSTLVAADLLDRRCYGIELDPRYVDVVVRRWERLSGRTAVLEAPRG